MAFGWENLRILLRDVFGGGSDISHANPLPVDISPGNKLVDTILNMATILAGATTTLANCILTGTHTGAAHATIMTDANAHFRASSLIGLIINNVTDGSTGVITANTETTITVILAGGAADQWATADVYTITGAGLDLLTGPGTLALTVDARYAAGAALGLRVHVRTSPTGAATGTHTGANHATIMTDAAAHFVPGALVGLLINNVTDLCGGVITANTENTVTVLALAGGTLNIWTTDDVYSIPGADYDPEDWDNWNAAFPANRILQQTEHYDPSPAYIKVIIENLDAGQAITDVTVRATRGG